MKEAKVGGDTSMSVRTQQPIIDSSEIGSQMNDLKNQIRIAWLFASKMSRRQDEFVMPADECELMHFCITDAECKANELLEAFFSYDDNRGQS